MNNHIFMQTAVALSKEAIESGKGGPFGCVIVKDGKVIGEGHNAVTSTNDPTAHAEIVAIRAACNYLKSFQLTDCEIFTSCEPCPMCLGAIYWARPKAVYYANTKTEAAKAGFDDGFIYDEIAKPLSQRSIPMIQLPEATAIEAFEQWLIKNNKKVY